MPKYVGLLRAVNLAGTSNLKMDVLAESLRRVGFDRVRTLLRSGNFVFSSRLTRPEEIELRIETLLAESFGLRTESFVRTPADWHTVVSENPFPDEALRDPGHTTVFVLKSPTAAPAWTALQESITGSERVRGARTHGYIVYPDGIGTSRLTTARIERALGTRGTTRNWNTVTKLDALLAQQ
ncbi:MAG: DUF1697 domain-containing protein [Thermoplasmata archaeon]